MRSEADHVLLAYDGSDSANAAVEAAGRLFAGRGADVVCVWRSIAAAAPVGSIAVPREVIGTACAQLDTEAEARAKALSEEGAARARDSGLQASGRAVKATSNTWVTLVRIANKDQPAAVVLGSRGHSGIKSVLLGSVATGVAHHSEVPVVIAPSPETTGSHPTSKFEQASKR